MSNVRRIKKRNFTATDNQLVRDNRLSWKARGIFNYLWSQSEEWNFYVEEVAKHSKDGIRALQSGLSELEKCGYLKRTMYRKDGKFNGMSWELSDTGDLTVNHKTCLTENTVDDKTCQTEKSTLRKNNNKKEQYTSNNNNNSSSARDFLDTNTKYIDSKSNNAFELYQIHVGMLTGHQLPKFTEYVQKLGDEVVQFAINLMLDQTSRPNFNYLQRILMKYEGLEVTTVEKAKEIEEQFKNKRQSSSNYNKRPQFEEKMPSWMKSTEPLAKSEDDNKNSQKNIKDLMDKINKKTEKNKTTKASEE